MGIGGPAVRARVLDDGGRTPGQVGRHMTASPTSAPPARAGNAPSEPVGRPGHAVRRVPRALLPDRLRAPLDVLVLDDARVPGGWVGLEGFFVLSGFLITTLLVVHQERTGTIGYRRFIGRRLVRLWPALLVMVAACIIPAHVISHLSWHDIGLSSIAAAGFFTNWTWRIGWPGDEWLGHLWSLGPGGPVLPDAAPAAHGPPATASPAGSGSACSARSPSGPLCGGESSGCTGTPGWTRTPSRRCASTRS